MLASSYKLPLLALTISLSALVSAKPYAPDLYEKAMLADDVVIERRIAASRPYAPDLYTRNAADPIQILKRSPNSSESSSSSWSPFNVLSKRSEEEMHSRGMISDDVFSKRGQCSRDYDCGNKYYCSTKKNTCYKKLKNGNQCTRNGACGSSFCNLSSNQCQSQKSTGSNCNGNDSACSSGYCSVRSSTCKPQASHGGSCAVDAGCAGALSCVNQTCHGSTSWTGNGNQNGKGGSHHNDGGHGNDHGKGGSNHNDGGHDDDHGNGHGGDKGHGNSPNKGNGNGYHNNGGKGHNGGHGTPSGPSHPSPSGSWNDKRSLHFIV